MKRSTKVAISRWVVWACLVNWALFLLLLVVPFTGDFHSYFLLYSFALLPLLSFASVIILLQGLTTRDPKREKSANGMAARIIASLIIGAIVVTVYSITKSLWISPWDITLNRFAYENIGGGAGFVAVLLLFILSAIQKDIYWVARGKTLQLDERQAKDRQQVFEKSYKIGAFLVLLSAWFFEMKLHSLPQIISINAGSIPGDIYWLPYSLALTLFALPLVIAAWRKK